MAEVGGRTVLDDVPRRAGGPLHIAAAERVAALPRLDAASGAVRAAVKGSAGRMPRHQRAAGTARNPRKAGRSALWGSVR